ncbi:MAG: hypothetical protein QGG42_06485 [Phycisphaerae bacterium]|nr:hypothetical protein [Phycisphaerae bacterium]
MMKLMVLAAVFVLWVCLDASGIAGPSNSTRISFLPLAGGTIVAYVLLYGFFFKRVGNYLYVRVSLRTAVRWGDMKILNPLFCFDKQLQWCEMKEVKELPREQRRQYLLQQAANLADRRIVGWWRYII